MKYFFIIFLILFIFNSCSSNISEDLKDKYPTAKILHDIRNCYSNSNYLIINDNTYIYINSTIAGQNYIIFTDNSKIDESK